MIPRYQMDRRSVPASDDCQTAIEIVACAQLGFLLAAEAESDVVDGGKSPARLARIVKRVRLGQPS